MTKDFRIRNNLTQEELARKLWVTPISVLRWEKGYSRPNNMAMKRLEELGVISVKKCSKCGRRL